jgi:selenocysteine-specific elongation factor
MAGVQVNITLGTAGHIDHGKTALVKCLTGCDTDRLKEEKQRGMSIELGYAPCTIAGTEIGIVDVPGHESFIKTMVAGATGMDGVILVVAADDAVMPQTREHLDILTLLGIRHGLVVLSKIDRVEPEQVELARADVLEAVRGTFLEGAPILPVSNVTGEGFDAFLEALLELVGRIEPRRLDGVFRLPLERAFSVQGYGTIAAGIPTTGSARVGDDVVLLPSGQVGRIKRIEVYGRTSDTVKAGQCAAINVGHWDHRTINRGDVLTSPGYFAPRQWYLARMRLLPHEKLALKSGAQVKFHTGTVEVAAVVYPLAATVLRGGGEHLVEFRTAEPIVAGPADHFIVRSLSPIQTIGGGILLEAVTRRFKRNRPEILADLEELSQAVLDPTRLVEYCVRRAESLAASDAELAERAKVPPARLQEILSALVQQGRIAALGGGLYLHRETAAETGNRIAEVLDDFHRRVPESPGMTLEDLRQANGIGKAVLEHVVAGLKAEGRLVERNGRLAKADHQVKFADQDAQRLQAVEELFHQQPFSPPSEEEVVEKTRLSAPVVQKLLRILREHGQLVAVEDLLFHREAVARARQILTEYLRKEGRLESVKFKYLLDTTRKYAIPLLDYFDRVGVTRRSGHTRFLKEASSKGIGS